MTRGHDIISEWAKIVDSHYLPLGKFYLPENMEMAWKEIILDWPRGLKKTASAICENGEIIISPAKYRALSKHSLGQQLSKAYIDAVSTIIHELIHCAKRNNGTANRDREFQKINEQYGVRMWDDTHLYLEESLAELYTIRIMSNEQITYKYWEDCTLAYQPAIFSVAKYLVNNFSLRFPLMHELITGVDVDKLVWHVTNIRAIDITGAGNNERLGWLSIVTT